MYKLELVCVGRQVKHLVLSTEVDKGALNAVGSELQLRYQFVN